MDTLPPPLPVGEIGHRESRWTVPDNGLTSRRARERGSGPYASAVPAALRDRRFDLPSELAADVADAEASLVAFDRGIAAAGKGTAGDPAGTADQQVLGPMSSILLRTESSSSSRIEDLTVGARQLALAALDESTSSNAGLVLANVRAMESALALTDHVDLDAILDMHRALMSGDPVHGQFAGKLRDQVVWIGRSATSPVQATFVPPAPDDVGPAMTDLVAFAARDDLPVLLQAAVAHAQFETIHPFTDGNGRTGRALVHAMLHGSGLLRLLAPPVSAGLLRDLDGYIDALTAFRAGDARSIVERLAAAARYAAVTGAQLLQDLDQELANSRESLHGLRPQAAGWRLLPSLVSQPVVNAAYVRHALDCADATAQRAIGQLADAGVLIERTGRSRGRVWHHPGILAVLDDYADAVRR
jgi:Fic family protein